MKRKSIFNLMEVFLSIVTTISLLKEQMEKDLSPNMKENLQQITLETMMNILFLVTTTTREENNGR